MWIPTSVETVSALSLVLDGFHDIEDRVNRGEVACRSAMPRRLMLAPLVNLAKDGFVDVW